jgi:hypothetical protein
MRKLIYLMLALVVFSSPEVGDESAFANTRAQQRQRGQCLENCSSQQYLCTTQCTSSSPPNCKQNCSANHHSCIRDCNVPGKSEHDAH